MKMKLRWTFGQEMFGISSVVYYEKNPVYWFGISLNNITDKAKSVWDKS